jgi:hypothetical protein
MEKAQQTEASKKISSVSSTIPTAAEIAEDYKEISKQMQVC